jgi:hypothetical protein
VDFAILTAEVQNKEFSAGGRNFGLNDHCFRICCVCGEEKLQEELEDETRHLTI